MRRFGKIAAILLLLYLLYLAGILAAMYQPPERFARIVSKLPGPVAFLTVPFKPMWYLARGGRLNPGDAAPDFDLSTPDKASRVRLSSFRGRQPVVLVFGSYT